MKSRHFENLWQSLWRHALFFVKSQCIAFDLVWTLPPGGDFRGRHCTWAPNQSLENNKKKIRFFFVKSQFILNTITAKWWFSRTDLSLYMSSKSEPRTRKKKTLEIGAFWKCMADFVTIFFRQITYRSRFSLNAERSDAKIGGKGDGDIAAFWQGRKIACVNTIFHYEP